MNPTNAPSEKIKTKARELGFSLCGITGPLPQKQIAFYEWWVNQGYGAQMHFLRAQKSRRSHIDKILPGARSVIVCAMRFPGSGETKMGAPEDSGKVARYMQTEDYHNTLLPLFTQLARYVDEACGVEGSLAYVDTGAISERAFGAAAGIGWIGKNAMLIHPEEGSWFWLGEVITRAELSFDSPSADRCGTCRKCLDACPTGAIVEDLRMVDSHKCIAYHNIENRGEIPEHVAAKMNPWLVGCDICQEVCPWNAQSLRKARAEIGEPAAGWLALSELEHISAEDFKGRFSHTSVSRVKHAGLVRNARVLNRNREKKI